MAVPKCSWCGEYRAHPDSEFCAMCRPHKDPGYQEPGAPLAPVTGRRNEPATACVWRRHDETGPWLIYGRHRHLQRSMRLGLPVRVKRADNTFSDIKLDYVSDPDDDDFAWGHPVGATTPRQAPSFLEPVRPRPRKPKVRRHQGGSRNQLRKARMR